MFSATQRFGLAVEEWVTEQLLVRGYEARLVSGFFAGVDIMIGPLAVEVKAARAHWHRAHWQKADRCGTYWRQRWQFDVTRIPRDVDSVLVLVAIDDQDRPWPFVVPSWLVWGRRNVHITNSPERYQGRLASCRNNWANVAMMLARRETQAGQLPLFISREMVTE